MEHFNEPHSSVNEPTPTQPNVGNNFGSAIGKSFFILIIQVFVMPIKVLKASVRSISSASQDGEETDFVILLWIKNLYEALIVLCYPLGLLGIVITALDMRHGAGQFFIGSVIMLYFIPIALGLFKELIAVTVINVVKLEEIARNTKKD
ncbi:MAG: hypothetical protein HOG85_00335 [Flavobacteriales bacterium]|jgi:hypothetical protein|nr:hypothetical protein [Flavobacteriales bacterium]